MTKENPAFTCGLCKKDFTDRREMAAHMLDKHDDMVRMALGMHPEKVRQFKEEAKEHRLMRKQMREEGLL